MSYAQEELATRQQGIALTGNLRFLCQLKQAVSQRIRMMIKGPLAVQRYATACAHCHIVVTEGEPIFLIESADDAEPDVYLHSNCLRAWLDAYEEA